MKEVNISCDVLALARGFSVIPPDWTYLPIGRIYRLAVFTDWPYLPIGLVYRLALFTHRSCSLLGFIVRTKSVINRTGLPRQENPKSRIVGNPNTNPKSRIAVAA